MGMQLVGPMFGDALVLRVARAYEATRPTARPVRLALTLDIPSSGR
jgi:Asp-tRNA(Asn)/Glu-tRNA(Gln) amidotransferase A subunit family amidase